MASETRQRREEMRQIFDEVLQIARGKATPLMVEFLDKSQKRFYELTERRKKEALLGE